jgi:predicted ArsR family transcriptional regulator
MVEKATRLADVRDKSGWFSKCHYDAENGFRIEEFHNPLKQIYEEYPNAVRMEVQMMEQLLGTKIARSEVSIGKGRKRVVYEIATLGIRQEGLKTLGSPIRKDHDGGQASLF